jgi:UDP-N-acetyl-D-mannosaminuronic acid dehydrogenase
MSEALDVCVVGGCGHVGVPLSITFAQAGVSVGAYDINQEAVALVRQCRMPFLEPGAEPALREVLGTKLEVTTDPTMISRAKIVIIVIGTPVDEHLNPTFHTMKRFIAEILPHLRDGQLLILRSTVYPGTTEKIHALLAESGKEIAVAFCPERVAEGRAMEELRSLPQIISGCSEKAIDDATDLFAKIAQSCVRLTPLEAELTKIFANVWRYIQFATSNQFFMIATEYGLDFYHIFDALTRDYPRMAGLPKAGFAAGPCLFKDTMQLAAAAENRFGLGHSAMLINEGLPNFVVKQAKQQFHLARMTVGLLGMAFKGESDDPRESLSYKLRKILEYEARSCLCTDEYVEDSSFLPLAEVIERSDLLIVGAPHRAYKTAAIPDGKPVIDVWNLYGKGAFPT